MAERQKGLLLAMMEPPPAFEEEFNDWYDTEHVPERKAIPGFETAQRFVCVDGFPKYVAVYDLTYLEVLDEPAYRAVAYDRFSPWTKRVQSRTQGRYRAAARQVYPGNAVTMRLSRLIVVRFSDIDPRTEKEIIEGMVKSYGACPETLQVRVFRNDIDGRTDYLGLVDEQAPYSANKLDLAAFGSARAHIDLINTYVPFWRQR